MSKKENVSQKFIKEYAEKTYIESRKLNPKAPVKVIKHICKIQIDVMIEHMQEHLEVVEFLYDVKKAIDNIKQSKLQYEQVHL